MAILQANDSNFDELVLQSDIGIICKSSGEEDYVVYTTDLLSARPK